jgi:hypothetical protein
MNNFRNFSFDTSTVKLCTHLCFNIFSSTSLQSTSYINSPPRKLMADLAAGGEEGEPVNKRSRLESIVPAPAPAKKRGSAAGQPPTSPPRPVPPPTPLWLSGQLPPPQPGRGSGPHHNNQRGGAPVRGNAPAVVRWPMGPLVKESE